MRALDTSRAGRTTGGIACAPPAPCLHGLTHWPFDLGERPPTGIPGRNERLGKREPPPPPPSAANVSLGLPAGQKPRRGSMSTATSRILATAHRATALSALWPKVVSPQASPGGMSGSADRQMPLRRSRWMLAQLLMDTGRQKTTLALLMQACPTPTAPQQDNQTAFTFASRETSARSSSRIALVGRKHLNG